MKTSEKFTYAANSHDFNYANGGYSKAEADEFSKKSKEESRKRVILEKLEKEKVIDVSLPVNLFIYSMIYYFFGFNAVLIFGLFDISNQLRLLNRNKNESKGK